MDKKVAKMVFQRLAFMVHYSQAETPPPPPRLRHPPLTILGLLMLGKNARRDHEAIQVTEIVIGPS